VWALCWQISCRPPRFDPVIAFHRQVAPCARIKHAVTTRSQERMHLFWYHPPVALAHLPTQFAV
jgi:hypothetical protein